MNTKSECLIITEFALKIITFFINLAFTIGGSIVLDNSSELSNDSEFSNVWICNLVLTILSGIGAFISITRCCYFDLSSRNNDDKEKNNNLEVITQLGGLGISIWALILYFQKTDLEALNDASHQLFVLLEIRMYFTLIAFGIFALILIIMFGFCCVSLFSVESPDKKAIKDKKYVSTIQDAINGSENIV
jgi:hypothetical protein